MPMWRSVFVLVFVSLFPIACGQAQQNIIAGPFGVPRVVFDGAGQWRPVIEVYRDAKIIDFIPDVTDRGWLAWNAQGVRVNGRFVVMLYEYNRQTQETEPFWMVFYSTRKHLTVYDGGPFGKQQDFDIPSSSKHINASFGFIDRLVTSQVAKFKGMTVQESIEADRAAVARMAAQAYRQAEQPQ